MSLSALFLLTVIAPRRLSQFVSSANPPSHCQPLPPWILANRLQITVISSSPRLRRKSLPRPLPPLPLPRRHRAAGGPRQCRTPRGRRGSGGEGEKPSSTRSAMRTSSSSAWLGRWRLRPIPLQSGIAVASPPRRTARLQQPPTRHTPSCYSRSRERSKRGWAIRRQWQGQSGQERDGRKRRRFSPPRGWPHRRCSQPRRPVLATWTLHCSPPSRRSQPPVRAVSVAAAAACTDAVSLVMPLFLDHLAPLGPSLAKKDPSVTSAPQLYGESLTL